MINIAKKIQAHRQATQQTLRDMAEKTGLSTAIISQLERNIGNPSLSVLTALADAMGIKVSELVAEEPDWESLILRKGDRQQTFNPDEQYIIYNALTPDSMNANLSLMLVHLEPRSETYGGEFHAHTVEEVVYVLTGSVFIVFESARFEIACGDTVRIPANYRHRYINESDEVSEVLAIKTRRLA